MGLFLVSIVDSSVIPLPIPGTTDLLLILFIVHGGNPWQLAIGVVSGSILGGYTTWHLGKKGGEAALKRYIVKRRRAQISAWMQHHPILAVFLPAILPPPIPLSPFVLASGALGVSFSRFLAVFSFARALRYSLVAWLAATYGRVVVRMWFRTQNQWSTPLLWTFAGLMVAGMFYGIWRFRRSKQTEDEDEPPMERAEARGD